MVAAAEAAVPAVHVPAAAKAAASAAQTAAAQVLCSFVNLYKQWLNPKKERRGIVPEEMINLWFCSLGLFLPVFNREQN